MKTILKLYLLAAILSLQLLCSCATNRTVQPRLPADVTLNQAAGRGDLIFLTIRLADGTALPFILDTGCPLTLIENSQVARLGKRLDTGTFWNFGAKQEVGVYAVPKLHLGNTLLMAGTNAVSFDIKKLSSPAHRPFMGILGMDVLRHYCIQLDFTADKLRFLNDERADKTNWGEPFPLTDLGNGCPVIKGNLLGAQGSDSEIDTGCGYDGWLTPKLFQQWTNQTQSPVAAEVPSPNGVLGGETYSELDLHAMGKQAVLKNQSGVEFNGIGLHLLSQNLVTLDFPNKTMYLKRTSLWPLMDKEMEAKIKSMAKSAAKFLYHLRKKGQLPGWSITDKVSDKKGAFHAHFPNSGILDVLKEQDPSIYHYDLVRNPKKGDWKLRRAWRTDEKERTLEEYPVP